MICVGRGTTAGYVRGALQWLLQRIPRPFQQTAFRHRALSILHNLLESQPLHAKSEPDLAVLSCVSLLCC